MWKLTEIRNKTYDKSQVTFIDSYLEYIRDFKHDFQFDEKYGEFQRNHPEYGEIDSEDHKWLYNALAHQINAIQFNNKENTRMTVTPLGFDLISYEGIVGYNWHVIRKKAFTIGLPILAVLISITEPIVNHFTTDEVLIADTVLVRIVQPPQLEKSNSPTANSHNVPLDTSNTGQLLRPCN